MMHITTSMDLKKIEWLGFSSKTGAPPFSRSGSAPASTSDVLNKETPESAEPSSLTNLLP